MTKKVVNTKPQTTGKKEAAKQPADSNAMKSLKIAESQVTKAMSAQHKANVKVTTASDRAKVATEKANKLRSESTKEAAKRAKQALQEAMAERKEAAAAVRKARESLTKVKQQIKVMEAERLLTERKEAAKQKAVDSFVKQWEYAWNKKVKSRSKPQLKKVA